jgi:hypothetical protein
VANRTLWSVPPSRSTKDMTVEFTTRGRDCLLHLRDTYDPLVTFELRFLGVVAYSFLGELLVTLEHIEAFEKVVELTDSGWGSGLAGDRATVKRSQLHHYRAFIDENGAYDILAEAFLATDASPPDFGPAGTA